MPLEGRRFRRRKKEVIFVEGVFIDHAQDVTPGIDRNDETYHLFGLESPETDVQHNYGTLTIGVLDKFTNNALLDLLTSQDPAATAPRQYKIEDLTSVQVWANIKDTKNTRYVKAWYMGGWAAGMPMPSGDPNAKAVYSVSGNAELPRQFEGCWLHAVKLASGPSANLGFTPLQVPGEASIFAVSIRAIDETSGFDQEKIIPSAAMVASDGAVDFDEIEAAMQDLDTCTHAYVVFLQSGTGVYPNVAPMSIRASV